MLQMEPWRRHAVLFWAKLVGPGRWVMGLLMQATGTMADTNFSNYCEKRVTCFLSWIWRKKRTDQLEKQYCTTDNLGILTITYLSFSSGAIPRAALHTGQDSIPSSPIFFRIQSRQTAYKKAVTRGTPQAGMQVSCRDLKESNFTCLANENNIRSKLAS